MQKVEIPIIPRPTGWFTKKHETYQVCTSWHDVKLRQYVMSQVNYVPGENREWAEEDVRWQVACFSTIPLALLEKLPLSEVLKVLKMLGFLKTKPPLSRVTKFEIDGETFELMPDFSQESLLKYVYAEDRILKVEQTRQSIADGYYHKIPELIATIVTPAGGAYDTRRLPELAIKFGGLPFLTALSITHFFFTTLKTLEAASLRFSLNQRIAPPPRRIITPRGTRGRLRLRIFALTGQAVLTLRSVGRRCYGASDRFFRSLSGAFSKTGQRNPGTRSINGSKN